MVIRRLNRNSEPQASIEAGQYTLQYVYTLFPCRTIYIFRLLHQLLQYNIHSFKLSTADMFMPISAAISFQTRSAFSASVTVHTRENWPSHICPTSLPNLPLLIALQPTFHLGVDRMPLLSSTPSFSVPKRHIRIAVQARILTSSMMSYATLPK